MAIPLLTGKYSRAWKSVTYAPRIADVAIGRDNNFNLVRFVAASMVILYHELCMTQTPATMEPIYFLTRGRDDSGSIAVAVFFIISGFLVTQSFIRGGGGLREYLSARVLRIFPALWAAVLFTIVVSSFASAVPWGRYLTDPQTIRYWATNSFLWNQQFTLPGAFLHARLANVVNGSLWTLPMEFGMYMVCALLGLLGIYATRVVFNGVALAILLAAGVEKLNGIPFVSNSYPSTQWALAFLVGAALYLNRNEIRLSIPVAILLLGSTYFITQPDTGRIYILPMLAYATLCFSLHPALVVRAFNRVGDYSYGLYVYAFPLQQYILFRIPRLHWLTGFALTYPIILLVAVLSWHLIEKPALKLKRIFRRRIALETLRDAELARV